MSVIAEPHNGYKLREFRAQWRSVKAWLKGHIKSGHMNDLSRRKALRRYFTFSVLISLLCIEGRWGCCRVRAIYLLVRISASSRRTFSCLYARSQWWRAKKKKSSHISILLACLPACTAEIMNRTYVLYLVAPRTCAQIAAEAAAAAFRAVPDLNLDGVLIQIVRVVLVQAWILKESTSSLLGSPFDWDILIEINSWVTEKKMQDQP